MNEPLTFADFARAVAQAAMNAEMASGQGVPSIATSFGGGPALGAAPGGEMPGMGPSEGGGLPVPMPQGDPSGGFQFPPGGPGEPPPGSAGNFGAPTFFPVPDMPAPSGPGEPYVPGGAASAGLGAGGLTPGPGEYVPGGAADFGLGAGGLTPTRPGQVPGAPAPSPGAGTNFGPYDPRNLPGAAALAARNGLPQGYGGNANFAAPNSGFVRLTPADFGEMLNAPIPGRAVSPPQYPPGMLAAQLGPRGAGMTGYPRTMQPEDYARLRPRLADPNAPLGPMGGTPPVTSTSFAEGATNDPQTQALIAVRQLAAGDPNLPEAVRAELEALTRGIMANDPAAIARAQEIAKRLQAAGTAQRPPVPGGTQPPAAGATQPGATQRPPVPGGAVPPAAAAPVSSPPAAAAQPGASLPPTPPPNNVGAAQNADTGAGSGGTRVAFGLGAGGAGYPNDQVPAGSAASLPPPAPGDFVAPPPNVYGPGAGPVGRDNTAVPVGRPATGMGAAADRDERNVPSGAEPSMPIGAPASDPITAPDAAQPAALPPAAAGARSWPVDPSYPLTSEPGDDVRASGGSGSHAGVDIGVPQGTELRAPASGTVALVGDNGRYGNTITIAGDDGNQYIMAHLLSMNVEQGQRVSAGQSIGATGGAPGVRGSGVSTGPHLHFEVRDPSGRQVDPRSIRGK